MLPTVIASDATTKNQAPDIDIMAFQISPGAAKGTSSRQNRRQAPRRRPSDTSLQVARHGLQRLVEAEGHVPGLGGEDREDRRQLRPEHPPGKQVRKKVMVKGMKPSTGIDCRMSSSGISTISARRLFTASAP